jgi:class 3 adenylate cyclase
MSASKEIEAVFVIADLSGYTALTETHGDTYAADVVARYVELADAALRRGARRSDRVGDEILIVADVAIAALETAIRLREAVDREPLFPTIRVGIHGGTVVERDGTYFGAVLNLTSRIASHARGGQILGTRVVAEVAALLPGLEARSIGSVRFRNVAEPVDVWEILGGSSEIAFLDPVCRMQVRPETAPARLPFAGHTFFFCSFECARTFAAAPERYVSA